MRKVLLTLSVCMAGLALATANDKDGNFEKTVTTTTTIVKGDTTTVTTTTVTKSEADDGSSPKKSLKSRLTLGGYGEAVMTRNFFSDNINRYSKAQDYRNKSHGQFDLPHAVIMLGFDFGRGWTFGTEIEFEHGGTESAVEMEMEEAGEWESEIERGGEVALEQMWINKEIKPWLQIRAGHMVVPVGLLNNHHLPNEYFTVYRPEGESTIIPSTWHETGLSIWGRYRKIRYEAMVMPALNSMMFSKDNWIKYGSSSPFEFRPGNNYAVAGRLDYYPADGLRLGVSGYYGHSFNNSLQSDKDGTYKGTKGAVSIGSFDFYYDRAGLIARGNFTYGHLSDADVISDVNRNSQKTSPYKHTLVGKQAISYGAEVGYDIFRFFPKLRDKDRFYVFGRYEYYDAYKPATSEYRDYKWTERNRMAVGVNYMPMKQIVIKAEYSRRFLHSQYNDEPSISLGVTYAGFFL